MHVVETGLGVTIFKASNSKGFRYRISLHEICSIYVATLKRPRHSSYFVHIACNFHPTCRKAIQHHKTCRYLNTNQTMTITYFKRILEYRERIFKVSEGGNIEGRNIEYC